MKCVIAHWCANDSDDHDYNKHWMPRLKKELNLKNIEVEIPVMPSSWQPDYEKFKNEFEKYAIDENTVLVGHSCGCAFLVRWLWETEKRVSKLILVAPWNINISEGNVYKEKFYTYPIDKDIQNRVDKITMFTSDNEKEAWKESLKIFHKAIGWKIIELKSRGHYRIQEFPELLKIILE